MPKNHPDNSQCMFHRKRTEEVNNKTVNGRRNSDNYVRKDGQDDKRVSTRRYNLGGGYLPDGTIDKIVATKYKRGTNLHTKTSRLKISNTRLKKFASGELLPPMGSGRGRGGYIDDNWYRSSYEIIMARYLILAGIKFDYEKIEFPIMVVQNFLILRWIMRFMKYMDGRINLM